MLLIEVVLDIPESAFGQDAALLGVGQEVGYLLT